MDKLFEQTNYGFLIEITMKKIKQTLQRRLSAKGYDLTVDQWVILDQLIKKNGLSQREIAALIFKDPPTVTRILDLLVKKSLVSRVQLDDDRRKFHIELTEAGRQKYKQILPEVVALREAGWQDLSEEDLADLVRILQTVFKNMETYDKVTV